MPQKVLDQIKWLCREIPKVEWSGILFYSFEGSIKDPENMVLTLEDILPMHKGNATYTEYAFDERVINYMMDNPESDNWKMGHIHSHNTMAVYFSGTDWSELEDNSPNHNFYLSLIVNNFMDFCAKVAFIVESDQAQFVAKDENGEKYHYSIEALAQQKLVTYDCAIESPQTAIEVSEGFAGKVKGIIADAEQRVKIAKSKTVVKTLYTPGGSGVGKPQTNPGIAAWGNPGQGQSLAELVEAEQKTEVLEEFTRFVLNTGNDISELHTIEDCLDFYIPYQVSGAMLAKNIVDKYAAIYDVYFDKSPEKDSPEMFEEILEGVIGELTEEKFMSAKREHTLMLSPVIDSLDRLLLNFKKYEPEHNG